MRCIFCKCDSAASRSVEHIIPEALENIEHVLPRGVVCDTCNNYFARKVEGPLLQTLWFRHARARQVIANKRGLMPPMSAVIPGARLGVNLWLDEAGLSLSALNERDEGVLYSALVSGRAKSLYIPIVDKIEEPLMSRFLAKVAIEILAHRLMNVEGWEEPLIDDPQLEPLRRFARIGDKPTSWPFSRRRIYGEDDVQTDGDNGYQVLHEFDLLYTETRELYAVLCIFGEEFSINYGGPEIDGYERWLKNNEGRSPLYLRDRLPVPPIIAA